MITTTSIPREHFNKWYGLFKASSGRFLTNPVEYIDKVTVVYEFKCIPDCNNFNKAYRLISTPIVEKERPLRLIVRFERIVKQILALLVEFK